MQRYGVARQTVQNAIDLLRKEGLVIGRQGAGWFVREQPVVYRVSGMRLRRSERQAGRGALLTDATLNGRPPSVSTTLRIEPADERTASELDINAGDEVLVRDRVIKDGDRTIQLATSRLPRAITEGTPIEEQNPGPGGIYARLEDAGHTLYQFEERVTSRPASAAEAELLDLLGNYVLTVTRRAFAEGDKPVEINDMVFAPERYELVYDIPAD